MKSSYFFKNDFKVLNNHLILTDSSKYQTDLIPVTYLEKTVEISRNLIDDLIEDEGLYSFFLDLIKTESTHLLINEDVSVPISFIVACLKNINNEKAYNILNITSYDAMKNKFYNETFKTGDYEVPISDLFTMLEFDEDEYYMFKESTKTLTYEKNIMCSLLRTFIDETNILSKFDLSEKLELLKKYEVSINFNYFMCDNTKFNYKIKTFNDVENFLYNYIKMCEELDNEKDLYLNIINYLKINSLFYNISNRELEIGKVYVDLNEITLKNNISLSHMNECIIGVVTPKDIDIHKIHERIIVDRLKDINIMSFKSTFKSENKLELKKCIAIFVKCLDDLKGIDIISYVKKLKEILFYNYKTIKIYVIPKDNFDVKILLEVNTFYYLIDKDIKTITSNEAASLKESGILC